ILLCSVLLIPRPADAPPSAWIATWAASPQSAGPNPGASLRILEDQTVRERVRVSLGGSGIRVRLSNEYGAQALVVGAATVAQPEDPASVKAGSPQPLTFSGHRSISIPEGAVVLSDPLVFPLSQGEEISISLYLPKRVLTPTVHWLALKRAIVSAPG